MVDCPSQFCDHGVLSPVKGGGAYFCVRCGFVASQERFLELAAVAEAESVLAAATPPPVKMKAVDKSPAKSESKPKKGKLFVSRGTKKKTASKAKGKGK